MILYCSLRPSPTSHMQPTLRLRCRDFTFFAFEFGDDKQARDVYETIRALTCKVGRLDKLQAFSYKPKPPENEQNGWQVYDPRREWKRLGISPKDSEKGWRISEINIEYKYSETYPALIVVPTKVSDSVLRYAGAYRSRNRIPALVYRHPINNCSITRSSQPTPGISGKRNPQDERLIAAIFATNRGWRSTQNQTPTPAGSTPDSSVVNLNDSAVVSSFATVGDADAADAGQTNAEDLVASNETEPEFPKVYGAQQRNLIVDARPTVNAIAMQAIGKGSEDMKYYPNAEKAYLGIDNVHVMRKSLDQVVEALKDSDMMDLPPNKQLLANSKWTKHIANILDGTALIARTVGIMHSHVLIHCSDGWDRTSQLSALSQICLDPYYRTIEGFIVLVEKDWLSFGHMFRHRSGLLSSDKWFQIENERIDRNRTGQGGGGGFGDVLRGARGLWSRPNESTESLDQGMNGESLQNAPETAPATDAVHPTLPSSRIGIAEMHRETKVNELSPVFHQFLDATYQLLYQNPTRFEFNERFLRRVFYHLYSCQYGTFMFDNEKERVESKATERTRSVWDYFLCRKEEFTNKKYDPTVDDSVRGQERIIFPKKGEARWWAESFGRTDEEMNSFGPQVSLSPHTSNARSPPNGSRSATPVAQEPIVTGTETANGATGAGNTGEGTSSSPMPPTHAILQSSGSSNINNTASPLDAVAAFSQDLGQDLAAKIANFGLGSSRGVSPGGGRSRSRSTDLRKEVEVEMQ
ncbi:phosphatases II [Byssothecium circinans]|uniref:Phosphatases II n=1 Tax=Byssothecium circinans TaxID=147558 RepID=A0A6A5U0L1_9PLEO|nr:phosphatases II [Byssothecium circinans]